MINITELLAQGENAAIEFEEIGEEFKVTLEL
jgi:hypothetical protein